MERKEAEKLTTHVFQLEQELMRGTWSEDEEAMKLIAFAKNFETNVQQSEKIKGNTKQS